jgi:hypothetical protein
VPNVPQGIKDPPERLWGAPVWVDANIDRLDGFYKWGLIDKPEGFFVDAKILPGPVKGARRARLGHVNLHLST